ncbi:AN1-type zinc finger protein 1 [Halocaridina rubra]|uniref:AN1-type zinc finger protein 1 n=1 Tax=Halocaridina rubra TaxID=373956 RepID=A0AAN9A6Z5_HALRR
MEKGASSEPLRYHCDHLNCSNTELAPVICPGCSKNFCLQHRHKVDHDCLAYEAPVNPMAEAAAKIEKITERLNSADIKKGQGRKSDKLAAKVQLMKLKQKSSGQADLPQEERLYFLVFLPKTFAGQSQASVFLSQHWSIGKAVDVIASIAKVPNHNNITGADKLVLFRTSDGSSLGAMDVKLKSLFDDQQLFNGQSLIMEYVPQSVVQLESFKNYKS